MDVIHAALFGALVVAVATGLHFYRMWQIANRAYDAARQRADMAEDRESWLRATWHKATQQAADLAQQLATLRVDKFAVPEQRQFEERKDPEPLSAELVDFLDSIQNAEAREIVEDEVEAMRQAGISDTEILSRIERGD